MMEFEKQSEMMDMKQEMMNDAIDDAMDDADDEEETEEIVNKVLEEIGINLDAQVRFLIQIWVKGEDGRSHQVSIHIFI